jgi:hypothetical protein
MLDATTLNLGRMGALVATGSCSYLDARIIPQPGDLMQLEVDLPAHTGFGQRCLACQALAVRAATEEGRLVVALQFERIEIKNLLSRLAVTDRLEVM